MNSSAPQKKMVLFINLLGKGLTQEMEFEAPSDGLLKSVSDHIEVWRRNSKLLSSVKRIPPDHLIIINK